MIVVYIEILFVLGIFIEIVWIIKKKFIKILIINGNCLFVFWVVGI